MLKTSMSKIWFVALFLIGQLLISSCKQRGGEFFVVPDAAKGLDA